MKGDKEVKYGNYIFQMVKKMPETKDMIVGYIKKNKEKISRYKKD